MYRLRGMLGLVLFAWVPLGSAAFEVVKNNVQVPEAGQLREMVWRAGVPPEGRFDYVQVHRYSSTRTPRAALLYYPGSNMNGEMALVDEEHNLWVYLANRGVDVYTMDYRTHMLPATVEDQSFAREWTFRRFVEDAAKVAEFVDEQSGDRPLFVSGFSLGVRFAYAEVATKAAAGQRPYAGLILLDGSFKSYRERDPGDAAARRSRLEKSGRFLSDLGGRRGWENRHQLMARTYQNPAGKALDDRYASIAEQLTETLYTAWGKGGLTNPKDGVADIVVLSRLLDGYDRYMPTMLGVEMQSISASDDDPTTEIDDGWGDFRLPVLYFGATGMGPDSLMSGIYSASHSGAKDVTIHVLENHGHLDVLVGERAAALVFEPAYDWLLKRSER